MGIGRRVADLWGFCGARRKPLTCLAGSTLAPTYCNSWMPTITPPSNLALPDRPSHRGNSAPNPEYGFTR